MAKLGVTSTKFALLMVNKITLIVMAIIAFAIIIPISISTYRDWQVYYKGMVVNAVVVKPQSSVGFVGVRINGHIYDKSVSKYMANTFNKGDTIQLRYLQGYETHMLFANDDPRTGDFLCILMLFISGVACLYYAIKGEPPSLNPSGMKPGWLSQ